MRLKKVSAVALAISGSVMLAGCGGDPWITVSGVAAKGEALPGAAVTVSCASGSGSATTSSTGTYSSQFIGVGPCLIKAVSGTTALYSFTTGTGDAKANVTPMTNMFVTYLANSGTNAYATPETFFAASTAFLSNTATVTSFVAPFIAVVNTLLPPTAQLDATALSGFLTASFTAGADNPIDNALETLKAEAVVTETGVPSTSTTEAVKEAADDQVTPGEGVTATGATGGTGASGGGG